MSQRLLISKKTHISINDDIFDCIYTEDSNVKNLIYEWCGYDDETNGFIGPWKIFIRDYCLIDKFKKDFIKIKKTIPLLHCLDCICDINDKNGLVNL